MRIKIGSCREKITNLLFLGCIFCSSMFVFENYSGIVSSTLLLFLSVLIAILNLKYLTKNQMMNCVVILATLVFSMIINRSFASIDIRAGIVIASAFLVIQSISYNEFKKKYVDCIVIIAAFSLVAYFLYKIVPGFFDRFPRYLWRNNSVLFVNLWLSVVPVGMQDYFRNFGIFYEPGIFQFYLNTALLMEFFSKGKISIFRVTVLATAVITTLSTNGYISLVLVFFAYGITVITTSEKKTNAKKKIGFLTIVALVAVVFIVLLDKGIIGSRVFMKFSSTRTSGSYYDRTNAISYALGKITQNPVFGVAARGIEDAFNATFTPCNWMMLYGMVIELYAVVGFGSYFASLTSQKWAKLCVAIAAFSSILTQDLSFEWVVWCFIFAGLKWSNSKSNQKKTTVSSYEIEN